MELKELQRHWNRLGETDPFWAVLTDPTKRGRKWRPDEFFQRGEREIAEVMENVERLGVQLARRRALDFGCGVGRLTQALCRYFEQCAGVDIAPSMIRVARKYNRYGNRCQYYLNEADDLRLFEDNTFDFIYSVIVLQHIRPEYSRKYIQEFLRVLTPGGMAVFQIPSEPIIAPDHLTTGQPLPDGAFRAEVIPEKSTLITKPGVPTVVQVRVKNLGDAPWPAYDPVDRYPVNLGNHWLHITGEMLANDDGRAYLPVTVAPQSAIDLSLSVNPPAKPGRYILELDMVQEGVTWFKDKGSTTARINVRVRHSSPVGAIRDWIQGFVRRLNKEVPIAEESAYFAPRMEMHGIPREEVIRLLEEHGGKVVDVQADGWAGYDWSSFTYYVVKS